MKYITSFLLAILLAAHSFAASVIPTPVHTPSGTGIGPGVIIARSYPGLSPSNKTLIRGRDVNGSVVDIVTDARRVSWSWDGISLTVYYGAAGIRSFPISNPDPSWRFGMVVSGGGPEPITARASAGGTAFVLGYPATLLIPESYATGAVDLPATSVRHTLFRYEEVLP